MRMKRIYFLLFLYLVLSVCSEKSYHELKIYRFIDNLTTENILRSPLSGVQEESFNISIHYPVHSRPLADMGSGENPLGIKRKIKLGGTERNILFSPPKTEISYSINPKGSSVVEFGIGIVKGDDSQDFQDLSPGKNRGTTFVVYLEKEEKRKVLFQKYLSPPQKEESPAFSWHSIDLPDIRDSAQLVFVTEGDESNYSFWSNPVLYKRQEGAQNVILISVDTLRSDHLGCYGYQRKTSPRIDSLALDGVTFLNTYASSPWTLPSHVSLLTSLHCVHHQVYYDDEAMDPSLISLADVLRQNQMYCAALTGGGFVSSIYGFSKGFDTYSDDSGGIFRQDSAEHLFQLVSQWLDNHKDKGFFLFLHTYQPHNPYACPYPYKTMFLQEGATWRHLDLMSHLGGKPGIFIPLTEEERQNVVDLYDGEIRYTDEGLIGPLIQKLKDLDLYDQSMVVFTSDHGEEFYDHQGWGHGHSLYDESLKVPLIIKFPESAYKGKRISNFVSLVDIFPTIMEEVGIDSDNLDLDGKSLFPLVVGQEKGDRTFLADIASNVLDSHIPRKISMNKGGEKLILNQNFRKEDLEFFVAQPPHNALVEIYNVSQDRGETKNMAGVKPELAHQIIQDINQIYKEAIKRRTGKLELDEELKKQLKALGYIR
jgi:arylsulfatase A-like enzyme